MAMLFWDKKNKGEILINIPPSSIHYSTNRLI